jgi:hypothetical protein
MMRVSGRELCTMNILGCRESYRAKNHKSHKSPRNVATLLATIALCENKSILNMDWESIINRAMSALNSKSRV